MASFDFNLGVWQISDLGKRMTREISLEDEVEIAQLVHKGMEVNQYYKRSEMELLAKTQLRKHNKSNGNKACQRAVSYVQKHMSDKVLTFSRLVWPCGTIAQRTQQSSRGK